MKYLFDNNLSPKFAAMLRALDVEVEHLRERFAEDADDPDIFRSLDGENVVWVSSDTRQLTRKQESRALKQAGVTAVYFRPFFRKRRLWDQAAWIVRRWPKIDGFADSVVRGTVALVQENGKAKIFHL